MRSSWIPGWRWILGTGLVLVGAITAGAPANAASFGPLALVSPSAAGDEPLTGSLTLDVASVPVASPTVLRLTDVSVSGAGATFALDPSVLSPGLGVVQPDGSFLIPTLFLVVDDGTTLFDLAIANVTGTLSFGAGGSVVGLDSSFFIDTAQGELAVHVVAVPEPATAFLLTLGLYALAIRAKQEIAR